MDGGAPNVQYDMGRVDKGKESQGIKISHTKGLTKLQFCKWKAAMKLLNSFSSQEESTR